MTPHNQINHHSTVYWTDNENQIEVSETYLPQKTANGLPKYAIRTESSENGSFTMSFVRCDTSTVVDKLSRGIADEDIWLLFSGDDYRAVDTDAEEKRLVDTFADLVDYLSEIGDKQ